MHHYPGPVDPTGRPVPIGEPLWSSINTVWSGFNLEIIRQGENGCLRELRDRCVGIAMTLSGISRVEMQADRAKQRGLATPGALVLSGRDYEWQSYSWSGTNDVLFAELDLAKVEAIFRPRELPPELIPNRQFLTRDPQISAILYSMMSEAKDQCPSGRLYGQSLSLALAAYVASRYSRRPCEKDAGSRLSGAQLKRLRDYVHSRLGEELNLGELASVLDMSASRFCQLFRNTVGIAPYQYVLHQRISESMRFLSSGRMSIIEVAQTMGFADQSHFTKVFKKITSTTPKQFQLSRGPLSPSEDLNKR